MKFIVALCVLLSAVAAQMGAMSQMKPIDDDEKLALFISYKSVIEASTNQVYQTFKPTEYS